MPRNSSDTQSSILLLTHAEKMFAEDGVFAVTNRQITEAAGQKTESALNYLALEHATELSSLRC